MIVAKILLLFPPLLLLANAQGGGRFGFFSRPDFRRPRPWDRPTMAPVPDTPMPTEKVAEHVTDSPRARTELPTIAAERSSSAAPVISVPRFGPRGRVWARPVFGPRPTEISTPAATTSTELITIKPDYNSPVVSVVSSTTESEGYTSTPSTRVPFVDNHAQYKDPNNFNSRGRYSPKLTHNNEEIPSDSMKTTTTTTSTRVPFVDNHAQYKDPNNFDSRGRYSPKLTNNNEQIPSDSMKTTTTTTSTRVPFVDNHAQYKDPNNFDSRGRYSPKLTNNNEQIPSDSMKTTTTTTSTRVPFVDNHAQYKDPNNFDSRGRYSPKLTNNNEQIPSDSMKTTTTTTSTRVPFVDNHAQYKDPNNFDSRGRYSPKLTNNNEKIPSDSMKTTTTKIPSTTEKITKRVTEQTTTTTEKQSPMTSSTSTTTTEVPFINNHIKYNESLSNNLETGFPTQAPLHLDAPITEIKSTPAPSTTPRVNFIPTRAPNFDSRSRFPPYMSHNIPTSNIRPLSVPGDYSKSTSTTIAPNTGLPSSTTESVRFTIDPSTHVPFVDEFNKYDSVYLTKKTPIPFKIISTTETAPATTYHYNSMYQISYNDEYNITNDSQLPSTTTPKVITMGTKEPEEYIVTATPILALQEEYDNGFTSQPPVEYTNGYEKTSNIPSTFYDDNAQIYPVYRPDNGKVSHYEGSSPSTREPERYTVATTTKIPFIDFQKINDDGFTSAPPVEYTNGHAKITEILPSTNGFDEFIQNIYKNNNHKENYEHSWTPKTVPTTVPTTQSYQFTRPTTTTDQAPVTQPVRYTNTYRYNDITTKPTTRYTTTTTAKPSTVAKNKVYDLNNFKCKNEDSYYSISNQCDDFIECKSGYPIQNTCPDGLHFNPAAKYPEFPCAYPSEVKCESNSALRKADPTSECPRRYGYFSMQDGSCDKYIMCQEGLATVMSCPAGLAFSVATSSCDWPSNVPDCIPGVFKGFTCPPPELNEDGQPIHSIYKYGYNKSCKKYIACQRGHPRLLSCDAGLAFDTVSESCVDEYEVTDCT